MNLKVLQNKTAIVTGATSGIGKSTAEILAQNGCNLIICGRRKKRLDELANELKKNNVDVISLDFDITDFDAVQRAFSSVFIDKWKPEILINNAGLAAGLAKIYEGDVNDWEAMINTNIKGLLYISRIITPFMVQIKKGHIVNIGSIAGKEVYDNGNVYCGTKHMVDALSQAMRRELAEFGVKVSAIHPGAVETEFSLVRFKGDQGRASAVYDGFENLIAEDIADAVLYVLTRPERVNINDMVIMPKAQPAASVIHRNKGL